MFPGSVFVGVRVRSVRAGGRVVRCVFELCRSLVLASCCDEEVGMRVQRVLMPDGSESWTVLGDDGAPMPAVEGFLAHLQALDRAPTTQQTYATSMKLWLSFLDRLGVDLD